MLHLEHAAVPGEICQCKPALYPSLGYIGPIDPLLNGLHQQGMNYCLRRSLSSSQAKVPVGCWWCTVCHHTAASPSSHSRAKVAHYCGLAIPANEKYSSQLYKKASSVAGSSLLPKKGRGFSSRTPLGRPPWPPLPPAPAPL